MSEEWISSADASILACGSGSLSVVEGRRRIIQRAQAGLVRARVRDVVKRVIKKSEPAPLPSPNEHGVYPLGTPLYIWELPIEKQRRSDEPLDEDEWLLSGLSDPNHPWWESGDLEFEATDGSREGVSLFGIEFLKADIEKLKPRPSTAVVTPITAADAPISVLAPVRTGRPRLPDSELRRTVSAYTKSNDPLPDVTRTVWPAIKARHPDHVVTRERVVAMIDEVVGMPRKQGPR